MCSAVFKWNARNQSNETCHLSGSQQLSLNFMSWNREHRILHDSVSNKKKKNLKVLSATSKKNKILNKIGWLNILTPWETDCVLSISISPKTSQFQHCKIGCSKRV